MRSAVVEKCGQEVTVVANYGIMNCVVRCAERVIARRAGPDGQYVVFWSPSTPGRLEIDTPDGERWEIMMGLW
jgi:hypothetical protein